VPDDEAINETPYIYDDTKLSLQVFTPPINADSPKKPVMVFIHGGAWQFGNAEMTNGSALAVHGDVVVVAISYRLAVLGFLFGNWGLFDQVEALKWVQENIDCYGGDKNNVTIFGESAGSWSVESHLVSDKSAGLFHRAICQSGCIKVTTMKNINKWQNYLALAKMKEICEVQSEEVLKEKLKAMSNEDIIDVCNKMGEAEINCEATFDNDFYGENPAYSNFKQRVPVLMGFNSTETAGMITEFIPGLLEGLSEKSMIETICHMHKFQPNHAKEYIERAKQVYDIDNKDNLFFSKLFCYSFADEVFLGALPRAIDNCNDQSIYFYQLDNQMKMFHEAPYKGTSEKTRPDFCRSDHGDDLILVFGGPFIADLKLKKEKFWTEAETLMCARMMTTWTEFARHGNPGFNSFDKNQEIYTFSTPTDFTCTANEPGFKKRIAFQRYNYNCEQF